MKKVIVTTLIYLCLSATAAWCQDAVAYYNRGLKSSLANKKIEFFSKALQLNPNLVEAYEKRAVHYYFQRRFDSAIQDYTRVVELKPHNVDAYLNLGLAYLKKEKGEGIKAEINHLAFHLSKQRIPDYSVSIERAIELFSRAIEIDPQLASAYSYRAEAYRIKRVTEKAIQDATIAIQLQGDRQSTARAYSTLSKIYWRLGQKELSEANFRKSVALDPFAPDYPPLHVPLMFHDYADTPNPETIGWLGVLAIIIVTFVVIFKLTLPAPKKRD